MPQEPMTVLLIEPDAAQATALEELFNRIEGMTFDFRVSKNEPDEEESLNSAANLIVCDISDLDNERAIANKLRTLQSASRPCIVLMASPNQLSNSDRESLNGACDFLVKQNMTASDMARSIRHVIDLEKIQCLEDKVHLLEHTAILLHRTSEFFNSNASLSAILQNCTQLLVSEFDIVFARIWVYDPSEEMLLLKASAGLHTHLDGGHAKVPIGFMRIGTIAGERTPHISNSLPTDPWVTDHDWVIKNKLVGFGGYPLIYDEKLVGVVALFSQHALTNSTLTVVESLVSIIGSGINRKLNEQKAALESRNARTLLEASADAMMVLDTKGMVKDMNTAAVRIFGYQREEMIGLPVFEFVEDPAVVRRAFKQTLATGSMHDYITLGQHGTGKLIHCSTNASVLRNDEGVVTGIITTTRDITDQLRQQAELVKLAAIIEHSSDAIISRTLDGLIVSWNKGAEKLYGYSADEMIGKSVECIFPENQRHEMTGLIERLKLAVPIEHFETQRITKSGNVIDVSVSISPIKDSSGQMVGVSVISRDICEKKRLERSLAISEAMFRQTCQGALDGIICIDRNGNVTIWNNAAERIFGYRANEVMGKNVHALVAPERYHDAFTAGLERFQRTGQGPILGKTLELEAIRADGSEIPVEISVSSIHVEGCYHAVGIVRDISERRKAELKVKNAEEALLAEKNTIARANETLSSQANELSKHAQQMELLTQLGEYLQICSSDQEAHSIVAQFAEKLFPNSSGALFIFKESRNWLERVSAWGADTDDIKGFPVTDCWSIRRGQPHSFSTSCAGPQCSHAESAENSLCVPLVLLGEIYGVMHVRWTIESNPDEDKLVTRLAGDAALALANLRLRKQLKDLSIRDPLTGLFNRRYMEEFFGQEIMRARRKSSQLSVLMIDIDHFKDFNDTYGHEAGDAVLHELGKFLKRQMRESDITCRFGGEEFIVLLSESPLDTAQMRAEHLRKAVKLMRVHSGDELLPEINISVGLAAFPLHGDNIEDIIRAADNALYLAKQQGRDRVCVAASGTEP